MPLNKKRRDGANDYEGEGSSSRKYVPVHNYNPQEICQDLYDIIRNQKTEEGKLLCEPFIRVPKRRNEPDYYTTVNVPMDLLKIQHRLKSEEYEDVDDMIEDINLMINNAKSFYNPESNEYKQAVELQTLFEKSKSQLISQALGVAMETEDDVAMTIDVASQEEEEDEEKVKPNDKKDHENSEDNNDNKFSGSRNQSCLLDESSRSGFSNVLSSGSEADEEKNKSVNNDDKKRKSVKRKRRTNKDLTEAMMIPNESTTTPTTSQLEDDDVMIEQLFSSTVSACDDTHCFTDLFRVMPSKIKYPEYYQVIKDPMDLRTIARKIQSSDYVNVDAMMKDFMLIISNAKTYNEPYSRIYKDATAMKKFLMSKKQEMEQLRQSRSQRTRGRSLLQQQHVSNMSTEYAAIKSDDDDNADDGGKHHHHRPHHHLHKSRFERSIAAATPTSSSAAAAAGSDDECSDTYSTTSATTTPHFETEYWHLFNSVKNYRDANDHAICEPFLRLPSRRFYPDYYQEIKRPLSLVKIQKKIKNGSYPTLDSIASDFNLVFDNAKQYNREDSRIYQDADILQKVMKAKHEELKKSKEASLKQSKAAAAAASNSSNVAAVGAGGGGGDDDDFIRRKRSRMSDDTLKKNLYTLYHAVFNFKIGSRSLIDIFRTLPLRKEYPDYYQVIKQPIDMNIIELKIKHDKYPNLMSLSMDLELMLNNARLYNEESSQVYRDADVLEKFMRSKLQAMVAQSTNQIAPNPSVVMTMMIDNKNKNNNSNGSNNNNDDDGDGDGDGGVAKKTDVNVNNMKMDNKQAFNFAPPDKCQKLFTMVRDHVDEHNRTLSTFFMKLPLKNEYPDYYNIITKPMDMQKIFQRMMTNHYAHIDEMFSDMHLMFNNACIYNEPDSQIFKDAILLQKLCTDYRTILNNESFLEFNSNNNVQLLTQQLLLQIFIEALQYTDGEGRYYSDSIYEYSLDDDDDNDDKRVYPLDVIQSKLEAGLINRLDSLQECLFKLFEHIRNSSPSNSQAYLDSIELARCFIMKRDEICCHGGVLLSSALSFTQLQLNQSIDNALQHNNNIESSDDDDDVFNGGGGDDDDEDGGDDNDGGVVEYEFNGVVYSRGDFVYIQSREPNSPPNIVFIEQLFNKSQQQENVEQQQQQEMFLKGCWFLRPGQTFHHQHRKFVDNEVMKSEFKDEVSFDKVVGRCLVVHIKHHITHETTSLPSEDIYICESAYIGKKKEFKKIKCWTQPKNPNITFTKRQQPFIPSRKPSQTTTLNIKNHNIKFFDCCRKVVVAENVADALEGCTYYQQLLVNSSCWIKIGDFVVVKTFNNFNPSNNVDSNKPTIVKVEKIWSTETGYSNISGPILLHPQMLENQVNNRMFYRKEVLLSNREMTHPCINIARVCSVMGTRDYFTCRYTHIPENDVYICEFKYNDVDKTLRKVNIPKKQQHLSVDVVQDEIYFFKQPFVIVREQLVVLPAATSTNLPYNNTPINNNSNKLDTKIFEEESMDFCSSIGDQPINESSSSFLIGGEVGGGGQSGELTPATTTKKKKKVRTTKVRNITGYIVYAGECRKDIQAEFPDFNFGDISRAVGTRWKSLPKEQKEKYEEKARMLASDANMKMNEYNINSVVPSPGAESRSMSPNSTLLPNNSNNNNNVIVGGRLIQLPTNLADQFQQQPLVTQFSYQAANSISSSGQPLFVSLPPQPQRVIHSEAYLRYIKGLAQNNKSIGDFNKTFHANKPESINMATTKLPSHWLAQGPGHHGDVVSALWALRDHMLKDAFNISKVLS